MAELPSLNWRLLGPSAPTSATGSAVIATIKENFVVSGSYWQLVESGHTGSFSLIVEPILNNGTGSSAGNLQVVICNNLTGSNVFQYNHTNTSADDRLSVGILVGSGSFKDFQHEEPFGQGKRWSKYYHIGVPSNVSASFVLESEETLLIGHKTTSTTFYAGYVGAILESLDSGSGEKVSGLTGRRYGIMATGATTISANWKVGANQWLGNSTSANSVGAGVLGASGSHKFDDWIHLEKISESSVAGTNEFTTADGFDIAWPIQMATDYTSNKYAVGTVRGLYVGKTQPAIGGLIEYISGSRTSGYGLAPISGPQMCFFPASGSREAGIDHGGNG